MLHGLDGDLRDIEKNFMMITWKGIRDGRLDRSLLVVDPDTIFAVEGIGHEAFPSTHRHHVIDKSKDQVQMRNEPPPKEASAGMSDEIDYLEPLEEELTDEGEDEYDESLVESVTSEHTSEQVITCLLYTSPSPRDQRGSRMPSSA